MEFIPSPDNPFNLLSQHDRMTYGHILGVFNVSLHGHTLNLKTLDKACSKMERKKWFPGYLMMNMGCS